MGLFTVGLRDDDFEPAYKFPALPHRVRGRFLVAFAGVHLAADDFAGCRAAPFSCAILGFSGIGGTV